MTIYLVRHARAGNRSAWLHDDELRPLSAPGHEQARGLIRALRDGDFEHVLSSPHVRCMETVVPLAAARRMAVEPADALAEGASTGEALALVHKHAGTGAVMCTHGDVIPALLEHFAQRGVYLGKQPKYPKGCTWVLTSDATNEVRAARYIPPPRVETPREGHE
jgi:broad specificity phosphatase PhoE